MTSNYDKYIRPKVWPIPVEEVGSVVEGRNLPGGMVEIRGVGATGISTGRWYILDAVPREHARGAIGAITAFVEACRKLTG